MQKSILDKEEYIKFAGHRAKRTNSVKNTAAAFIVGGLICVLGQLLCDLYMMIGISEDTSCSLVSISLIFLSCLFTALGWYDRLALIAGAGTLVPITGFANAVISPALDYKAEGMVAGMSAKMFIIAGPVIVYGTIASVIYGLIYYICTVLF